MWSSAARGVPVPVWGEPREDGAGRSHLGWHTGWSMLLLPVGAWVPGLPVGDMFPSPDLRGPLHGTNNGYNIVLHLF